MCQITGKKAMRGNKVSKSNHKTKRTFAPNLFSRKFFNPETGKWVSLKVSASGLRTINRIGLAASLKRASEKGYL